jgi:cell wall-associated NlpC family hydrolase
MLQRTHAAKIISAGRRRVARVATIRRTVAATVSAALVAAGALIAAPVASASSNMFPTMNDSGGIYWRSGTNWNSPIAKSGYGVYPGTKISVSCYQMGTANVPGSADAMWVNASWVSGPGTGSGWINEHFVNDGAPINKAAPGVPSCTPTPPPSRGGNVGSAIVKAAASMLGDHYCYDGGTISGPSHGDGNLDGATACGPQTVTGFDCTGLALYAVFQATHITLPHGQGIENVKGGTRITSESQLQPGDIILFGGSWTSYEHVGIYAGSGKMWDANIGDPYYPDGVQQRTLAWATHGLNFIGAVRF